jgi:hypothetical protein
LHIELSIAWIQTFSDFKILAIYATRPSYNLTRFIFNCSQAQPEGLQNGILQAHAWWLD